MRGALIKDIDPEVNIVVLEDAGSNDPQFVKTVLSLFDEMMPG